MGLIDRFIKKKTAAQLSKTADKKEEKKEEKKKVVEAAQEDKGTMQVGRLAYRVIVKPLITEKSAVMQSANKYTFVVAKWAKKFNVKEAIKEMYGVEPIDVNIINVGGRRVRFGRSLGKRSDFKKAIITLPAGKSITIHEGV